MRRIISALIAVAAVVASEDPIGDALPMLSVPRLPSPPAVTADPLDTAWAKAATIPGLGLSRRDADPLAPPIATTVQLGWDPGNLFIRFVCSDSELYLPNKGRDADLYRGDVAEVFLDVVGDGQAVLELQANAAGDVLDQIILLTAPARYRPNGGLTWDIVGRNFWPDRGWNMDDLRWAGKPLADGSGWIVDFAIPAKAGLRRLGLSEWKPMEIRANLMRYDWIPVAEGKRDLLAMNWSTVQYGCPHLSPSRMGWLRLVDTP